MEGEEIEPEECDPMKGWVTVGGRKACQEETETEEMSTPELERRKEMIQNPYLTWFLRTLAGGGMDSEERQKLWCSNLERLRKAGRRPEEVEEVLWEGQVMRLRDERSKVKEWLVREGVGELEAEKILY